MDFSSRYSDAPSPETCGHRKRHRCAPASARTRLAGFDFQECAPSRGGLVQIRKEASVRLICHLLRAEAAAGAVVAVVVS